MSDLKIFRDDDCSHETNLQQFAQVHELFKKYNVLHTVALICKDIQLNPELIKYINENNIDVQVHCWEHVDFTTLDTFEIRQQLYRCCNAIQEYFNKMPTVFYPPWNKTNANVREACELFGLTVSKTKISLSQYLAGKQGEVINFHSWSDECNDLEAAFIKYTS